MNIQLCWHCLVSDLPNRCSPIERLMRSLKIVVLHKFYESLADASVTAHPRIMEAVDSHFEGVKPLFDEVSLYIVKPTAQS
ncbi:hypothetical protein BN996_03171 [Haloferax massiliensis]|uniref:Uncharacterized protein n=1 Tax=Haloferax massiliensis TaxID=1476858 RepID=A0A0D6JUW4_9EURY|nr:hypothetical protein BN996_03171 [Haloferax massiliensis]